MADVYKNSICNIAATGATNCTEGCFFDRPGSIVQLCLIQLAEEGKYLVTDKQLFDEPEMSPLHRRAWVVQERLLAPRMLHYGKRQLFWDCNEHLACEAYPNGMTYENSGRWDTGQSGRLLMNIQRLSEISKADRVVDLQHGWAAIVNMYTRGNLTFAGDKLLALSGIATELQRTTADDYLAGIWRSNLSQQLLWRTAYLDGEPSGVKPPEYRAPSWSWASLDGKIFLGNLLESPSVPAASILDAQVSTIDDNNTGQVSHGILRVHGHIMEIEKGRLRFCSTKDPLGNLVLYEQLELYFDTREDAELQPPVDMVFCLPLVFSGITGRSTRVKGVLLKSCDDEANKGKYRRIGRFKTSTVAFSSLKNQ